MLEDEINRIWKVVRHLDLIRPFGFAVEAEADCLWRIRQAAAAYYIALIEQGEKRWIPPNMKNDAA